jgi:hypothetical protein
MGAIFMKLGRAPATQRIVIGMAFEPTARNRTFGDNFGAWVHKADARRWMSVSSCPHGASRLPAQYAGVDTPSASFGTGRRFRPTTGATLALQPAALDRSVAE